MKAKGNFKGEDSIDTPLNQFGYRGINLATALGDGINGEIQLHTEESWSIKLVTDEIYREYRDLTKEKADKLSSEEKRNYVNDIQESYKLWEEYWNHISPEVKRNASDSVMGLESPTSPTVPLNGIQESFSNTRGTSPDFIGCKSSTLPSDNTPKPGHAIETSPPGSSISNVSKNTTYTKKGTTAIKSIPIEERTIEEVGDIRIKAYMYEHPELKDFIQAEAIILLGELNSSIKGQKFVTYDDYGERFVTGTSRFVSESIERILNLSGATYAEIEDALYRIINDDGKENTALAKRIELVIDDNLSEGYKTFDGVFVERNYDYLEAKKKISTEHQNRENVTEDLTSKLGQQEQR